MPTETGQHCGHIACLGMSYCTLTRPDPPAPDERQAGLRSALREAYTLLVSAEPTLIRDARNGAPNATSLHYKNLLRDRVAAWLEPYRDNFDAGIAALAVAQVPAQEERPASCGAILNCALTSGHDDLHERADGIRWRWHENIDHLLRVPAQEERRNHEFDGIAAAVEAVERSADIYPEGRGCPACDGTGFVSDEDIERLRGLGIEVPHSEVRRALGVESKESDHA